jgi:2-iminobutanoate/2-iminopropanoate deaminase
MGPYSQGVRAGQFLFVAGQGPADPKTGRIASDIETQTRQTLNNVKAIIEASGLSLSDVVKTSLFLKNGSDFQKVNDVYKTFFQNNPPARTTIEVKFVAPDMLIGIDVIACRD